MLFLSILSNSVTWLPHEERQNLQSYLLNNSNIQDLLTRTELLLQFFSFACNETKSDSRKRSVLCIYCYYTNLL